MRLTSNSTKNIEYILDRNSEFMNITQRTYGAYGQSISKLYSMIKGSFSVAKKMKTKRNNISGDTNIKEYLNSKEINPSRYFPEQIHDYLVTMINKGVRHAFRIGKTNIIVSFFFHVDSMREDAVMQNYIDSSLPCILHWLSIALTLTDIKSLKKLDIDIMFTPFSKKLPKSNKEFTNALHVNSGFTQYDVTQKSRKQIFIYRHEEWFKVLIHETIHALEIDLSSMNIESYNRNVRNSMFLSYRECDINEVYAELWASIFNVGLFSFYKSSTKEDFMTRYEIYIEMEKIFSIMQSKKILGVFGIDYSMIHNEEYRRSYMSLYKENTNVCSYYILKSILLLNHKSFIIWCDKNNLNFVTFKKSESNLTKFTEYLISSIEGNDLPKYSLYHKKIHDLRNGHEGIKFNMKNRNLEMSLFEFLPSMIQ